MRSPGRGAFWIALIITACSTTDSDTTARAPAWHVTDTVTIGVTDGDPLYEFGRIMNAVRLSDGRIAVADYGTSEVRVFTQDGLHARTIGRKGQGPGEFPVLTRFARLAGDTLLAGGTYRLARFTADGVLIDDRTFAWTGLDRPPYHVENARPLSDGTFLVMLIRSSRGEPEERPLFRSGRLFFIVDADGAVRDSLGEFLGLEQMSYRDATGLHTAIPLFPPSTVVGFAHDHVVIGDMAADSVLRYRLSDAARTWLKLPLAREPIAASALEDARRTACDWTGDAETRAQCERDVSRLPEQSHYPVFRDIAVDSAGRVWVATYAEMERAGDAQWLVVDASSSVAARITLPDNLRIMQVGADYVLGVASDSLGVERVRQFRFRAP